MGAGYHLCCLAELLCERGFPKPVIVTYPRAQHERDKILLTNPKVYKNVFKTAEALELDVIESEDMNADTAIKMIQGKGCNAVFSLSWRWRIKQNFIDAFQNRVFNLHPTLLPKERGSGTFSYRIMNQINQVSGTIHYVNPAFDAGDIILQYEDAVDHPRPKPTDFLIATNAVYRHLLNEFLNLVEAEQQLPAIAQNEDDNTYLPLLNTETNGAIDWRWSAAEIERFIRAFGEPYPGAFTYCEGKRVTILDAEVIDSPINYHPFLNGRIISIRLDGSIHVIASGGLLHIHKIAIDGEALKPANGVKHTSILHTPSDILMHAHTTVMPAKKMPIPDKKIALQGEQ